MELNLNKVRWEQSVFVFFLVVVVRTYGRDFFFSFVVCIV